MGEATSYEASDNISSNISTIYGENNDRNEASEFISVIDCKPVFDPRGSLSPTSPQDTSPQDTEPSCNLS